MKDNTPVAPSYIDFEPNSELKEEKAVNTLIIRLPGFKKEQLKVQVSNVGVLKISGVKPENAERTTWRRFLKETKLPEGCDINQIRAKFTSDSELHITMPKKVTHASPTFVQQQPQQDPASAAPPSATQTEKAETSVPKDQKQKADQEPALVSSAQAEKAETPPLPKDLKQKIPTMGKYQDQLKEQVVGLGSNLTSLDSRKKVMVGFGVAVVTMVAIGAFVAYKYGTLPTSSSSYMEE